MSRLAKRPVIIPASVKVTLKGQELQMEGPKGKLTQDIHPDIHLNIDQSKGEIMVERVSDGKSQKALQGLFYRLITNMTVGVTEGFVKALEIVGMGYNAKMQGNNLILQIGFQAGPVNMPIPKAITIEIPDPMHIRVVGIDKQLVGQIAADIRGKRPPEPYKGKGIRYVGEVIRRKAGKALVSRE